jgi:hypothetical protein
MISPFSNPSQVSALDAVLVDSFVSRLCTEADYHMIRTDVVPIQVEHVRQSAILRFKEL